LRAFTSPVKMLNAHSKYNQKRSFLF
jgi:hypothetical protein